MAQTIYNKIAQVLDLDPIESKLFEILSTNQNTNISFLAKQAQVQRLKIYSILAKFNELGIMECVDSKKGIQLKSPTIILSYLQTKKVEAEETLNSYSKLLPDLLFQYYSKQSNPYITILEDKNTIIRLFLDLYNNTNKDIYFMGNSGQFEEFVGSYVIEELIKIRVKKQLSLKVLCYEQGTIIHQYSNKNSFQNRFVKWLPLEEKTQGYVHFSGDTVVLWNPVLARAIIIKDATMCSFYKSMFETIWNLLP